MEAWEEGHWGTLERPQKNSFDTTRAAQKDILGAKNINVLVAENWISYSRINGSDFMNNLYAHVLLMFGS